MPARNECLRNFELAKMLPLDEITAEVAGLLQEPQLKLFMDSIHDVLLILNSCRQIVFMNQSAVEILGPQLPEKIYGQRPGELLGCINAFDTPGGCGTGEACKFCGALNAILNAIENSTDVQECQIARRDGTSFDLRVWSTHLQLSGKSYIIFEARDISNEKRRYVLERIFFHDILNTAGGIKGISEMILTMPEDDIRELLIMIESAAATLLEEISAQKDLLAAENGELKLRVSEFYSRNILTEVLAIYKNHETAIGKNLSIAEDAEDFIICSDSRLLKRVVGNMTKNALEASKLQDNIILSVKKSGTMGCFSVWNPTFMSEETQKQVFKRSFSTKGLGRGIGTWSIKLLTETYMHGKISFSSTPDRGTFFFAEIPDAPV